MLKKTILESFLIYGLLGILSLYFINHLFVLKTIPNFLLEYSNYLWSFASGGEEDGILLRILKILLISIIPLLLLAAPVLTLVGVYSNHKKKKPENSEIEDSTTLNHLLPRNSKERFWVTVLSINAGFSEELFFRLLLPILIYTLTGSALFSILLSSIWFGLAHYYQGLPGIISTTIAGLMLFYIYLLTQSIWTTIIVHILMDISGLIIAPLFQKLLEQKEKRRLS